MDNKKNNRVWTLEYLRILSMVLITMSHLSSHGQWVQISLRNDISDIILSIFQIGGEVGVNCFILISGYFLIDGRFKVRSIITIVRKCLLYSWLCLLISLFLLGNRISVNQLFKGLFPITGSEYWFITTYIALYVTSPFISKGARALGKESWKRFLIVLFVLLSLIPLSPIANTIVSDYVWFVFVYLVGGFIRTYGIDNRKRQISMAALASLVFQILTSFIFIYCGRRTSWLAFLEGHDFYFKSMNMLPEFLLSLGVFAYVISLDGDCRLACLWMSKHVLAAYLITDNPLLRDEFWSLFITLYNNPVLLSLLGAPISLLIVIGSSLIDYMVNSLIWQRNGAFIESRFGELFDAVDSWFLGYPLSRRLH